MYFGDSVAYVVFGLRPGNVITRINGQPIRTFSMEELLDPLFFHSATDFSILNEERDGEVVIALNQ